MNTPVKASDILRKAASIINSGLTKSSNDRGGACNAIARADAALGQRSQGFWHNDSVAAKRARKYFASLYKPNNARPMDHWFGESNGWCNDFTKQTQEHRIIALLITADMAESVGD